MRRNTMLYALTGLSLCLTLGLLAVSEAQESSGWLDLRGQTNYTSEDLAQALFPAPSQPVRTRGVGTVRPLSALPVRTAVALNVLFAPNSENILPAYYPDLDKLGTVLSWPQYAEYRIQIEGHTDALGAAQRNQILSEKRVQSIKQYLVQRFQIAPERLHAVGYGASRPIAPNTTPEGRSQNRRVEVVNLGPGL
jgi:outer membrane protein OmpA-like peptidoglycan-associated protein